MIFNIKGLIPVVWWRCEQLQWTNGKKLLGIILLLEVVYPIAPSAGKKWLFSVEEPLGGCCVSWRLLYLDKFGVLYLTYLIHWNTFFYYPFYLKNLIWTPCTLFDNFGCWEERNRYWRNISLESWRLRSFNEQLQVLFVFQF